MKRVFIILLMCGFVSVGFAKPMTNLAFVKQKLIRYHDSGAYYYGIDKVTDRAQQYLAQRVAENNKLKTKKSLAVVFDIDETSLSNYPDMLKLDFGFVPKLADKMMEKADDKAIPGTLKLYQYAIANHVAVFFITGRKENLRKITEENLKNAGYTKWAKLYLEPEAYHEKTVIGFKSSTRKAIADKGYDIVFSMGDQYSDLAGGYADRTYKLPDPYYYIP